MLSRKTGVLAIAGVLIISGTALAQTTKIPDVVGTVNGEKITKDQLISAMLDWRASMTLDELIHNKLIEQEAKKAGVVVKPDEINAKIKEVKDSLPPTVDYATFLKQRGLTASHLTAILKMQLQVEKIVNKTISVTDKELADYRRASHILIAFKNAATEEEKAKAEQTAKEKIDKIHADIKAGTISFEDAAKQFSEDPATKVNGGDLNWFSKGNMVEEFESVVFALKPGEMSEPIKTMYGYHIIKLTQVGDKAAGEEKKELADGLRQQKQSEAIPAWLEQVKSKAKITNVLDPVKPKPAATKPAAAKPGAAADDGIDMPPPPPPAVK